MRRMLRTAAVLAMALLVTDTAALAQRNRGNVRSSARSSTHNTNRNVNRNTNINTNRNVNRNVNVDRDIDVDIDVDRHGGCCYHSGGGAFVAGAVVGAAVTAAVVGTRVTVLPPACTVVIVNGFTYQQCGTAWYQPQMSGGYVVVTAPR